MTQTRFATIPRAGLFTEEHDELRRAVRSFVQREVAPNAQAWEADGDFPRDLFRRAAAAGLFGAKYPEEVGGSGPDLVADAVITEELARCGSGGVAAALGAHKDLGTYYLWRFGTPEQHRRWLEPAIRGELVTALAITEPHAGSDVAGITTRAMPGRDGGWALTGAKTFITNGPIADVIAVAAKTDVDAGHSGISLFVVEAGGPGFVARRIETVGWRTSHTGELAFDGCELPADALLGELNGGFAHIMECFGWERVVMALSAAAGAERTLDEAIAYAGEREAFGRPVARFQVWRHRFADLATELEAAWSLTYHALREAVAGEPAGPAAAMAKWLSTELAWRVADEALQVHGGYGYMMEFPVQRAWRDSRLGPIGGGTTEIMKELVARSLGV